jgi:hypothetical protein
MLITLKAAGAITKGFLKAASNFMKGFLKVFGEGTSPLYIFQRLLSTNSYCYKRFSNTLWDRTGGFF